MSVISYPFLLYQQDVHTQEAFDDFISMVSLCLNALPNKSIYVEVEQQLGKRIRIIEKVMARNQADLKKFRDECLLYSIRYYPFCCRATACER